MVLSLIPPAYITILIPVAKQTHGNRSIFIERVSQQVNETAMEMECECLAEVVKEVERKSCVCIYVRYNITFKMNNRYAPARTMCGNNFEADVKK